MTPYRVNNGSGNGLVPSGTCTNIDLSSKVFCSIHLKAISQVLMNLISNMSLKIIRFFIHLLRPISHLVCVSQTCRARNRPERDCCCQFRGDFCSVFITADSLIGQGLYLDKANTQAACRVSRYHKITFDQFTSTCSESGQFHNVVPFPAQFLFRGY